MCCYQQCILLWGGDGRQEEQEEEEAVWFRRRRYSLIYPRKAQRNWRRTRRTKLNQQRKADSTGLRNFYLSQTSWKTFKVVCYGMHLKFDFTVDIAHL